MSTSKSFVRRLESQLRHHSLRATLIHQLSPFRRSADKWIWEVFVPNLWLLSMPFICEIAKRKSQGEFPPRSRLPVLMLVNNHLDSRHFRPVSADLTQRLDEWLRDRIQPESITYCSSLKHSPRKSGLHLVVANYDWLRHLPARGRLWRVLRELHYARAVRAVFIAVPVDLWSIRQNFYASSLVAGTGGWTLLPSNSAEQARDFLIPNPIQAAWSWPRPNEFVGSKPWSERGTLATIAASGDTNRAAYFEPLVVTLIDRGYQIEQTRKELPFADYEQLVQGARIVVTTCWIQPIFEVGAKRFRRRIADGHVTMRVWEGFSVGAAVLVPLVSALPHYGFFPNIHFVELPSSTEGWSTWTLPDEITLARIADSGNKRFNQIRNLELIDQRSFFLEMSAPKAKSDEAHLRPSSSNTGKEF